jgi:hypothetical protein
LVQDGLEYACCALLSAVNARRFLDGTPCVELGTEAFEALVDLTGCRHGSCISVEKAHRLFGVSCQLGPHDPEWIMWRLSEGRPVELTVFSPDWGLHSVLCVGATHEDAYLVNWARGRAISEVPWSRLETPPYARAAARAYALME